MRIQQLVHTLHYGDAISGEALTIKSALARIGINGSIYAVNAHEKVKSEASLLPLYELDRSTDSQTLVLHYSIASPLNDLFVQQQGVFKVLIYHNITPERWFQGYNSRVVADLIKAREGLERAVRAADLVLCDSEFNRSEILPFAPKESRVFPLVLDVDKWALNANSGISEILKGHRGKNFLHVGRTAPNKRLEDIVKVFYFYHHKINKQSRLWLIGSDTDTEIYSFELRRLLTELALEEAVTIVGAVADCELKAFYQNADIYLCMSEHEGFCVPLIEAMFFGLPIIAFDAGAVRDTIGNAGFVVSRKAHAQIAELASIIFEDSELQQKLKQAGAQRITEFTPAKFHQRLMEMLVEPAQAWERSNASGRA